MTHSFARIEGAALRIVRRWWRPATCIGIAGAMMVNGIIIPIARWETPDLAGLAALIASASAAFAVREWGKIAGTAGDNDRGAT